MTEGTEILVQEVEAQTGNPKARSSMLSWLSGVSFAIQNWDPNLLAARENLILRVHRPKDDHLIEKISFWLYGAPLAEMKISPEGHLRGWAVLNPGVN